MKEEIKMTKKHQIDRFYNPIEAKAIHSSNPPGCRFKAIFFDLDGTIVDTVPHICQSYQNSYKAFNLRIPNDEEIMAGIGRSLWDVVRETVPAEQNEAYIQHYRDYNQGFMLENTAVFWTAKRLLDQLKHLGIPLGVVTAKATKPALQNLHDFGLDHYFDVLIAHEDTDKHKPDPTPLLLGKSKLEQQLSKSFDLKDLLYIGDARYDVACAKNAGIEAALVQWTRMPLEPITAAGEFFVVYDGHDLA